MSLVALPIDNLKIRKRKNVLFLIMAVTQSYSEGILKLVNADAVFDKAAEVLFRSIVEGYINLNYIYSGRTEYNALVFIVDSILDRIDFAIKYKKFMARYPNWKYSFGNITDIKGWDNFITKESDEIKAIERKYKVKFPKKLPDIRVRAIEIDEYRKKKKGKITKKTSLEFYYVQYYKFFSQICHLTMPGLERFLIRDQNGQERVHIDGSPEDLDRILSMTYQIYYVMLRFTLKQFHVFNKQDFVRFDQYSKSLIS